MTPPIFPQTVPPFFPSHSSDVFERLATRRAPKIANNIGISLMRNNSSTRFFGPLAKPPTPGREGTDNKDLFNYFLMLSLRIAALNVNKDIYLKTAKLQNVVPDGAPTVI